MAPKRRLCRSEPESDCPSVLTHHCMVLHVYQTCKLFIFQQEVRPLQGGKNGDIHGSHGQGCPMLWYRPTMKFLLSQTLWRSESTRVNLNCNHPAIAIDYLLRKVSQSFRSLIWSRQLKQHRKHARSELKNYTVV